MNLDDLRQHIDQLRSQLVATAARDHDHQDVQRLHILLGAYEKLEERLRLPWSSPAFHSVFGRRRPSVAAMGLATTLRGCQTVSVTVSQLFRIHDLLYFPLAVRPTPWSEILNDGVAMRRAFNRTISLDDLGVLYPMRRLDRFWSHAFPDLRRDGHRPPILYFVPFELSPLPPPRGRANLSLLIQELITESLGTSADLVRYSSVASSLRLYPAGIGVIRLKITLDLKQDVFVELLARVARDIESLLFVDTSGNQLDVNAVLGELVEDICDRLFTDRGNHERRWQPPHTVFELHQGRFDPASHVQELAYLMSLSPREKESYARLQRRINSKLKSSYWKKEGLLGVTARQVMLLTHAQDETPAPRARPVAMDFMIEALELITAAHHAREAFLTLLEAMGSKRLPDASWADSEEDFQYVHALLQSMLRVFQGVAAVQQHLESTKLGAVLPVAREATTAMVRGELKRTENALQPISSWALEHAAGKEDRMLDIATLVGTIAKIHIPFYDPSRLPPTESNHDDELLESDMLAAIEAVDALLQSEAVDYERLDHAVFAAESSRRQLLGME
jgi:hypothetical protein